jgi:WD40 repeat protein
MRFFRRLILVLFLGGLLGRLFGFWSLKQVFLALLLVSGVFGIGAGVFLFIGAISLLTMDVYALEILKERLYTRIPLIGGWVRRKTATRLSQALQQERNKDVADLLAQAVVRTKDKKVDRIAVDALSHIDSQPCIDAAVTVWAETRHLTLTNLLVEQGWVASAPVEARVLSALKTGKLELVRQGAAEVVEPLVFACEDFDPDISGRARQVLPQLSREEAKEALCRFVIEHDEQDFPVAHEAALTIGYLPHESSQRALFLFLTEQWERYEALDFDYYLLSTAHRNASPELRRRIANKLRTAGRTDFLTVLAGADYHSRAADMTPAETDVLVHTLSDKQEWAKLWKLVFEIPFVWSIQIVKTLNRESWKPETGDEQRIFEELRVLADDNIITSEEKARQVIPLALQEATIRVKGRVNDVAFSPTHPVIAIGTGNRKVAVWNFQHGEMEQVFGGFNHSIGLVTFLPDGTLLCAERTNSVNEPCAMYLCRDGENVRLGQHKGSVTAIETVSETQLLSTGRDHKIILWDVPKRRKLKEKNMPFWARAAKVSPDGQYAALLHKKLTVINIPKLEGFTSWSKGSVGRCAAFIPNENMLIVGKSNGQVLAYEYAGQHFPIERQALENHHHRVQGVVVLPENSTVITAGSEGKLHFTNWTDRTSLGSVGVSDGSFTSLHLSPDSVFISTGDSDASMSLWDLRVLDVPMLFTRPFAKASPDSLITINELAANPKLESNVRQSLTFIQRVLQFRFRFDIEIDEVPAIKVGEFDIEIE